MEVVSVETKLKFKDYLNLSYQRVFQTWYVVLLFLIFLLVFLFGIAQFLQGKGNLQMPIASLVIVIFFLVQIYFIARKRYVNSAFSKESIVWQFDEEGLRLTGETQSRAASWNKINRVTMHNNWIFFWYDKREFLLFDRSCLNERQLEQLENILMRQNLIK